MNLVRGSHEEYFTEWFLKSYFSDLLHSFTSAEGKAESYNDLYRETEKTNYFLQFIKFNPTVGGHFRSKDETEGINDEDDDDLDYKGDGEEDLMSQASAMSEIHRKTLQTAFYNHQVRLELEERGIIDQWTFGPKHELSNQAKKITYRESMDNFMTEVDNWRLSEIYDHTCSAPCEERGCKKVIVMDGNWIHRGLSVVYVLLIALAHLPLADCPAVFFRLLILAFVIKYSRWWEQGMDGTPRTVGRGGSPPRPALY